MHLSFQNSKIVLKKTGKVSLVEYKRKDGLQWHCDTVMPDHAPRYKKISWGLGGQVKLLTHRTQFIRFY